MAGVAGPPARTAARTASRPVAERRIVVRELGTTAYAAGLALQADLVRARRSGALDDQLLLLEHPHVITLGTAAHAEHVLLDAAARAARGIELFETGRGGDVTYHGPGQLVGYPIIDLKPDRCDLHRYLRDIEEVLIRVLAGYGVAADRVAGMTGVWVGGDKIAAIGVRVSSGWITSHGFAFNVATDLDYFSTIVPCGLSRQGVTSLERVLGAAPPAAEVRRAVAERFAEVFERTSV
jgi:lipoyl(octanoyl) transferase